MNEKQILKLSRQYAKKQDFSINKDKKHLNFIIKGLKKNEEKYGYIFCPCRIITGDFDNDRKIICPCVYHKKEIKKWGHCLCKLFWRK